LLALMQMFAIQPFEDPVQAWLGVRRDIVICPVDLISNALRDRKMSAMLRFRHDEKLLDALLGLSEIFGLVGYMEYVPYALLNPAHCAPPAIRYSTTPA
jgi:hypothetical protein